VHNSSLGKRCFVGHGALLIGVKLDDGKFVPHGTLIDSQEKADALGPVPESLKHFNEEVVEVNKEFAESYALQDRMCNCR
jgi:carbonic anhydrase/acetyltransferase-like protein (isoleucine patch superfamily)